MFEIPARVLLLLVCLPAAAAQEQVLVGLTHKSPLVVRQTADGWKCNTNPCTPTNEPRVAPLAGGAAYDARHDVAWVTNGTRLDAVWFLGTACVARCTQQSVPGTDSSVFCTGLAYMQSGAKTSHGGPAPRGRLFFSYSTATLGWADTSQCQLSGFTTCALAFLGTRQASALACDEVGRRILIGTTLASAAPRIYVVDADTCQMLGSFDVTVSTTLCPGATQLTTITGLAYNPCTKFLYATDGKQVIAGELTMTPTPFGLSCGFTHRGCCTGPVEEYTGLALVPAEASSSGSSCTAAPCGSCPTMVNRTMGSAMLGNGDFAVELANAPANHALAVLGVGLGPCGAPGTNLGFCGPILLPLVPMAPLTFFYQNSPGGVACSASRVQPLPIPAQAALCGLAVSFQWLVACGSGTGVTNCVSLTIGK